MYKNKSFSFILMLFIIIISLLLYFNQIQVSNEYMGLKKFILETIYFLILFNSLIVLFIVLHSIKYDYPSSILIYIFILFVLIWNIVFYKSTNMISYETYLLLLFLIVTPLISLIILNKPFNYLISRYFIRINVLKSIKLEYILSLILIITLIIISQKMPISFNFDESYIRRMKGREVITGINAYFFAMSMNGIAPFLAFFAILNKKYRYFLFSLVFVILCFGFIGTKAPVAYVLFLGFFGFLFNKYKRVNIFNIFLIIISFVFLLSLIEYFINSFSIIADIVIRRAFVVVAQNQTYFIDFIINNFTLNNWLFGYELDKPITFLIGELYYNNLNTNANTNAFLYEFISNGILGYLLMIFFLSFFFSLLNFLYSKYQIKEVIGVAIIYSLLLTEQSYTTAFVSSGIGLLIILILLNVQGSINNKIEDKNEK